MDNGVDVIVTSPWTDAKKRQTDVLITTRKSRGKYSL